MKRAPPSRLRAAASHRRRRRVARGGAPSPVTADAQRERAHGPRDRRPARRRPIPVYGVNSALGANTGKPSRRRSAAYQLRAVRARAVGVGPRHPRDVVRAAMFARAAGMAAGGSGVSPPCSDARRDAQCARASASCRRSARSAPPTLRALAPGAAAGRRRRGRARRRSAAGRRSARARGPRTGDAGGEGRARADQRQCRDGRPAALVLHDAPRARRPRTSPPLALRGLSRQPLDPRSARAGRASRAGPARIARRLVALLEGSALWPDGAAARAGSASFRCVTQVHGAALAASRSRATTSRSSSTARPTARWSSGWRAAVERQLPHAGARARVRRVGSRALPLRGALRCAAAPATSATSGWTRTGRSAHAATWAAWKPSSGARHSPATPPPPRAPGVPTCWLPCSRSTAP